MASEKLVEVDRIYDQGRKRGVLGDVGQNLAGEGKKIARRFPQEQPLLLLLADRFADGDDCRVIEFDQECDLFTGHGVDAQGEHNLVDPLVPLDRDDIDVDRNLGHFLAQCRINLGRVGILEREVLDVLSEDAHGRLGRSAVHAELLGGGAAWLTRIGRAHNKRALRVVSQFESLPNQRPERRLFSGSCRLCAQRRTLAQGHRHSRF